MRARARLRRRALGHVLAAALAAVLGAAASAQAQTGGAPPAPERGRAAIAGVVESDDGRPLAGAVVRVLETGTTFVSDADGRFVLVSLPPDTVQVEVRRIGYAPTAFVIGLVDEVTVHVRVTLRPLVQELGTIVVDGERQDLALAAAGFYARRRSAVAATFLGPEEFAGVRGSVRLSTVLREVPRLRVETRGGVARALLRAGSGYCQMPVFLDGQHVAWAHEVGVDALLPPGSVHAVEIYRSASGVPTDFLVPGFSQCGALAIWSRPFERDADPPREDRR